MDRKKRNYLYSQNLCTENPKDSMKKINVRASKHSTKFQDTKPTCNNQWYIYKSVINNQKGRKPRNPSKNQKAPQNQTRHWCWCWEIYIYRHIYPPAMQETLVRSLVWEDPLEKAKATHSSILAWRIPWIV